MLVLFGCTTVCIESELGPVAVRVERHGGWLACTCWDPCRHTWPLTPRNRRASNPSTSFFPASTASRQRQAPRQASVPNRQAGLATGAGPPWPGRCVLAFSTVTATLAGGCGAWGEFTRATYRYVVFSFWLQAIGSSAGAAVEDAGKRLATLRCEAETRSELGPDYFGAACLPAPNRDFLP